MAAPLNNLLFGLLITVFIVAAVGTYYIIINNIGSNDNKQEVRNAIQTIIMTNIGLVVALGFIATLYIRSAPLLKDNYMFAMLHVNFLMSLTAIGISALVQLSPASS